MDPLLTLWLTSSMDPPMDPPMALPDGVAGRVSGPSVTLCDHLRPFLTLCGPLRLSFDPSLTL